MIELSTQTIQIDAQIQGLIPALSNEELTQLEENVIAEGCLDPLIVWAEKGILLDGHHRLEICQRHGIPYNVTEVSLFDRVAAEDWVDRHQLGRRNLGPDQMSLLRGRRCNRAEKRPGERNDLTSCQSDTRLPVVERLAKEHGVSPSTIVRDSRFAAAVEKLGVAEEVATGSVPAPRAEVVEVAKQLGDSPTPEQVEQAREKVLKPRVASNSGFAGWYTPEYVITAAREVLGEIDLDPASSAAANTVVKASRFYTEEDDGLAQPWAGRLWINPPYSNALVSGFVAKLIENFRTGEVTAAIVLSNNATETQWAQSLLKEANAICFPSSRVKYWSPEKETCGPLQGQMIGYFGPDTGAFVERFSQLGTTMTRIEP